MKIFTLPIALIAFTLTGCATSTTPTPPCCYQGAVNTARLGTLDVHTTDGKSAKFSDLLIGFTPADSLFTSELPFSEAEYQDFIYASIEPLFAVYDANHNGLLERPEIIALYAQEALLASGVDVRQIGANNPTGAISAPTADVGGLVDWVKARRGTMNDRGRIIFRDLEHLGLDLRTRGSENEDVSVWN